MNEILQKISKDELEGNTREKGLLSFTQSELEYLCRRNIQSPSAVRDYSDAEPMLAAMGFTPLFVNPESMTA